MMVVGLQWLMGWWRGGSVKRKIIQALQLTQWRLRPYSTQAFFWANVPQQRLWWRLNANKKWVMHTNTWVHKGKNKYSCKCCCSGHTIVKMQMRIFFFFKFHLNYKSGIWKTVVHKAKPQEQHLGSGLLCRTGETPVQSGVGLTWRLLSLHYF